MAVKKHRRWKCAGRGRKSFRGLSSYPDQGSLERYAALLGLELTRLGWSITTAESCTGGWAAQAITAIPGSSGWFDCGLVTYSNASKQTLLGVTEETLATWGAVSTETAKAMALGAMHCSRSQAAIAITGIAGPGGGSDYEPVGTVCFAWCLEADEVSVDRKHFHGNRTQVRAQAVAYAFQRMLATLKAVQ